MLVLMRLLQLFLGVLALLALLVASIVNGRFEFIGSLAFGFTFVVGVYLMQKKINILSNPLVEKIYRFRVIQGVLSFYALLQFIALFTDNVLKMKIYHLFFLSLCIWGVVAIHKKILINDKKR